MKNHAQIISDGDGLAFYSPYSPMMLSEFKLVVPASDRRWDAARKCWLVTANHLTTLETLCANYDLTVVKQLTPVYNAPRSVQKIMRVDYIGVPKDRGDGTVTAMASVNGDWSLVFPLDVLRGWFDIGVPAAPSVGLTYYATLNVKANATADEIKRGYRAMAKRWHPDVNHDPDATTMFKRIGAAYDVLNDPQKRRLYDAGLALEATLKASRQGAPDLFQDAWRPPLRCGLILVEGREQLGRLIVSKILQWQPIVNARGQELVTSWPNGAETWVETWV